jgi:hypothetical protein
MLQDFVDESILKIGMEGSQNSSHGALRFGSRRERTTINMK